MGEGPDDASMKLILDLSISKLLDKDSEADNKLHCMLDERILCIWQRFWDVVLVTSGETGKKVCSALLYS